MSEIGIDVVSIDRIEKWLEDEDILNRIFTDNEKCILKERPDPHKHLAGRFAAKEAAMKALGTGWAKGINWKDIEVVNNNKGKPGLNFYGNAMKLTDKKKALLSITYTPEFAIAMVVISD